MNKRGPSKTALHGRRQQLEQWREVYYRAVAEIEAIKERHYAELPEKLPEPDTDQHRECLALLIKQIHEEGEWSQRYVGDRECTTTLPKFIHWLDRTMCTLDMIRCSPEGEELDCGSDYVRDAYRRAAKFKYSGRPAAPQGKFGADEAHAELDRLRTWAIAVLANPDGALAPDTAPGNRIYQHRLKLDEDSLVATLDGTAFALTQDQFHVLRKISEEGGGWVSSTDIATTKGQRIDRIVRVLPEELRRIIESKRGTGYRILLSTP